MVYRHFRFNCIRRVLILSVTIFLFFYFFYQTSYYVSTIIIGLLIIYQIYALIYYVDKTNRDLTHFLESIRHSDFTQTFVGRGFGKSYDELKAAFTAVIQDFRQARSEKEEHFRYLQTVVQHVAIGLIVYKPDGEVELINTAAKKLLKISHLKNIQSLQSFSPKLVRTLFQLHSGEKSLVKINYNNDFFQLALYATEFRLREQLFILVSIQNIHSELEEKEMEAWQNLIRVMTHEIMNSITPIASLAATANEMLATEACVQKSGDEVLAEMVDDIRTALQTIERRSQGLLNFVNAYRSLTRIPKPSIHIFLVTELFQRVHQLIATQIQEKSVDFATSVNPETLELTADPELIEQVLINLLMNAVQAVAPQKNARIMLKGLLDAEGHILIQIIDNGVGIRKEIQDKIFIPFFTTKPNGSGIGLSLSRQIMRLHHGTIYVNSIPKVETVFTLRF